MRLISAALSHATISNLPVSIVVTRFERLRFILPREAKMLVVCLRSAAEKASANKFSLSGLP